MFSSWLKGPVDESLEGRKKRLIEAGRPDPGERQRRQASADRRAAALERKAEREGGEVAPSLPATPEGTAGTAAPTAASAPTAAPMAASAPTAAPMAASAPNPISSPEPNEQRPESSPIGSNITGFIDKIAAIADKTQGDKTSQKILEFLESKKSKNYLEKYIERYSQWRQGIPSMMENTKFDESDMDGSIEKLLLNNLNMIKGDDGLYRERPRSAKDEFLLAGASVPGEGRGEPRFLLFDEIINLQKRADLLSAAENGDATEIQKQMLLNNVDWDTSKRWYQKLPRDLQTSLNGNGSPTGDILDAEGIEFFPDPNNEDGKGFSGLTNIDEEQEGFSNSAGDNRGIFLLQKILSQGGLDTLSGLPLHGLSQKYTTIDHLQGRSTGDDDRKFKMESPVNMGVVRRGLNQNKVSSGRKGTPDADTIKALLKGAGGKKLAGRALNKELGGLGISDAKDELDSDLFESPHFMRYVMSLITDNSDHFDDFTEQREFTKQLQAPSSVGDIIDLAQQGNEFGDEFGLRKFLANPNYVSEYAGLDLANMAMIMPRSRDYTGNLAVPNTWRGSPGGGNEYESRLSPLKMSLLSNLFVNPENTQEIDNVSEQIKRDGFDFKNWSTRDGSTLTKFLKAQEKMWESEGLNKDEIKERFNEIRNRYKSEDFDIENPDHKLLHDLVLRNMRSQKAYKQGGRAMRAIGANYAFGNDDLDTDNFVSKLTDLGLTKMQFLKDIDKEGHGTLEEMLLDNMSDYRKALKDKLPGGPMPRGEEMYERLLNDDKGQAVAKQMAATRLGRGFMTPKMVEAYLNRKFSTRVPEQVPTDELEESIYIGNFTQFLQNMI